MTGFTERLLLLVAADMKRRGRSQRSMAPLLGVHHSTLSKWLRREQGLNGFNVDCIVGYFGTQHIIDSLRRDDLDAGFR